MSEYQIVKGIIKQKKSEQREGWKTEKTSLLIDGDDAGWYSGFAEIPQEKGDGVALSLVQNGNYLNIKSCIAWQPEGEQPKVTEEVIADTPEQPTPVKPRNSRITTIQHENIDEWKDQINAYNDNHTVFATQTHVNLFPTGKIMYTAILFYK